MRGMIKKYYKEFLLRGLMVAGAGPLVLAIIYGVLGKVGVIEFLTPDQVVRAIISITILAFLAAAITVIYKIEELPLPSAIITHAVVLYICYAITYIFNDWIKLQLAPFLAFTVIFILGYALIWCIIYILIRKDTEKINKSLKKCRRN